MNSRECDHDHSAYLKIDFIRSFRIPRLQHILMRYHQASYNRKVVIDLIWLTLEVYNLISNLGMVSFYSVRQEVNKIK